jgi:hypothetical protein
MLRFLYVVLFERSFDLSTDWGERASLERPPATGHLQRYRQARQRNAERERTNVGSRLFYLMFGELWLQPAVSTSATSLA